MQLRYFINEKALILLLYLLKDLIIFQMEIKADITQEELIFNF